MTGSRLLLSVLAVALMAVAGSTLLGPASPVAFVAGAEGDGARYRLTDGAARQAAVARLPAAAPLRFSAGIAASDQQVVRDAVAGAHPQARRVVELVAGLVTVRLAKPAAGVAGRMTSTRQGYDVELDLGGVYRQHGLRGIRRLTLHELAHVVDHALVPAALEAQLDAATPAGIGCDGGNSGGCAAREERFAESFAKWATGDVGHDLYLGYRVPPPTSLSGWGAPLAALTR